MLCDFKRSTEKVGLRIQPGKTKILSNQSSNIRKEIGIDDIKVEISTREESTEYLGQMTTFQQQETTEIRNRIRAAWATFHKYRQELISRTYMLKHPLWLFDAVVSPTMNYASGAWTPTKEHERMIQSTQCKMLRLTIQTKRRYKKIEKRKDETKENDDTIDLSSTEDENEDGQGTNTHNHKDSDISFESDTDDEIDTPEIEEEEWIEYTRRSTDEAIEKMENAKIRFCIETHKRMKWRLALRVASLPSERWIVKVAEWNPELSSRYKTYRAIGRPRRRWEDDITEFIKLEEKETENSTESDNKSWIKAAKDCGRWTLLAGDDTMTAEERSENVARHRTNHQSNGVRLSDDEVANIT